MKSRIKTDLLSWLGFICRSSGILLCWVGLSFSSAQAATDCTQVTQIPQAECETLVALYNSTNGPNWPNNRDWNITNEPCQWEGVFCGDGHVALIDKGGSNLVGTLPDLSALTFLQSLILGFYTSQDGGHYNGGGTYQLTGTLPNLSALTHLTFLVLGGNRFTGTLNLSLFPSSLQSLHLTYTNLEGSIPNFRWKLPNLIHLDLSGNSLTGPIDSSYFPTSLQLLRLSDISLNQSFPDFSSLNHLTHLELSSSGYPFGTTQLSSPVSPSYLPSSLVELDLHFNPLNQPIPDLSSLTNLTKLNLEGTQLSGPKLVTVTTGRLSVHRIVLNPVLA